MTIASVIRTAAALGLGLIATSATAGTVTETFDFTNAGRESGSVLSFTSGALAVDASATAGGAATALGRYGSHGLYVSYDGDNSTRIDGLIDEIVSFAFSRPVQIAEVTFGHIARNSMFDLAIDSVAVGAYSVDIATLLSGVGETFSIGASDDASAFKITSVTVSYDTLAAVPVPAGGLLLIGGLGALAALRRRKAKS